MKHTLLALAVINVALIVLDAYLFATLDTPLRWGLLIITPLPAFAALYAIRVWGRSA